MLRVQLGCIFSLLLLLFGVLSAEGQTTPTSIAVSTSGTYVSGSLSSVSSVDNNYYEVRSALWGGTYEQSGIETDFTIGAVPPGVQNCGFVVTSYAEPGCTLFFNIYNWSTGLFDYINAYPISSTKTDIPFTLSTSTQLSKYVNASGQMRCIFRALIPTRISALTYTWYVDRVQFYYAPTAPTNLVAIGQTPSQIGLTWSNGSANSSKIYVQRRLTSAAVTSYGTIATLLPTATSYTDSTGLSPGTSYTYRVAGYNFGGLAPYSNEATALTSVSSPPNLVALSLVDDVLASGATTTGTVTLDGLATTPTVVTLASSSTSFTVPTSVTIPSGSNSATFTVRAPTTTALVQGTILATLRNWKQTADVAAGSVAVTNVTTDEGFGSVEVSWDAIDPRLLHTTLTGYYVKRTLGGVTSTLNSTPITQPAFVDTTAVSGVTYTYQVVLLNRLGATYASSATTTDSTLTSGTTVSWVLSPPTTASGVISLSGTVNSSTTMITGSILVDGVPIGTLATSTGISGNSPYSVFGSLDTRTLANGSHTIQLLENTTAGLAVSTAKTCTFSNSVLIRRIDDDFDSANSTDFAAFQVTVVNPLSAWTLSVLNSAGSAIRTYSSTTSNATVAWDGKTSSGAAAGDGDFSFSFSVNAGAPGQIGLLAALMSHTGDPTALSLIQFIPEDQFSTGVSAGLQYGINIQNVYNSLKASHSGFYGLVIKRAPAANVTKLAKDIKRWLSTTVNDFYIYDHGNPTEINFSGISILAGSPYYTSPRGKTKDLSKGSIYSLYMQVITPTRPTHFNSVFLDACNSAGGNVASPGNPGTISTAFGQSFGMFSGLRCFVGWNGYSGTIRYPDSDDISQWGSFDNWYWTYIGRGQTVVTALANAIGSMTGSFGFHPDDPDRLYTYGDTTIP